MYINCLYVFIYFFTYTYFALENALTKISALFMVVGLTFGQERKGFGQVMLFQNQRYYPCVGLPQPEHLAYGWCLLLFLIEYLDKETGEKITR